MLETTISARILAAFFASVVALALLAAAWVIDRPVVGMLGLVAANVCTVLVIQHDHAKRDDCFATRSARRVLPCRTCGVSDDHPLSARPLPTVPPADEAGQHGYPR
jgi:hypothetical protein